MKKALLKENPEPCQIKGVVFTENGQRYHPIQGASLVGAVIVQDKDSAWIELRDTYARRVLESGQRKALMVLKATLKRPQERSMGYDHLKLHFQLQMGIPHIFHTPLIGSPGDPKNNVLEQFYFFW